MFVSSKFWVRDYLEFFLKGNVSEIILLEAITKILIKRSNIC